ncbi:tRNA pseudouridine(13) synthase TruD [Salinirarus marinus]|uniref:tRNA pseudouridine(13) synthase TruD n=1 Tax=Salinirarus marinus TaxID=3068310 RepID=UPI003C6BDBA7
MREAHPLERQVGMEYYVSDADGVGGHLRDEPADFRVRELERVDPEPLDADPGAYAHLLLRVTLRGWDTNDFAARISDALGISRERVSWAGTKDKHAVTTQLFTVRGVAPDDLPEIRDADVEAVGRVGRALEFGDLAGNAFDVRVRDPDCPECADDVTADLRAFVDGEAAVPNYFGQQRFGSRRPVTHEVGLHVVRGEWRGAVLAYVGNPAETEPDETRAARAFADDQAASDDPDWSLALDEMPRYLGYERSMLHRLDEREATDDPADFRYALEAVPSNLQRMFVNAAQSYLFNRVLSERLRRGLPFHRPVAGDVVCFADRDAPEGLVVPDVDRRQRATDDRVDVLRRHCDRGRAFVTAPLIGTETELGDGEPGDIERGVLADVGVDPGDFALPGNFDSSGTRRAILVRPDVEVTDDPLRFSFSLPSGSYATVVLREYLKIDPLDL